MCCIGVRLKYYSPVISYYIRYYILRATFIFGRYLLATLFVNTITIAHYYSDNDRTTRRAFLRFLKFRQSFVRKSFMDFLVYHVSRQAINEEIIYLRA